jgi:predicted phage terminase large subunit-like protein
MNDCSPHEVRAFMRLDFCSFLQRSFHELMPQAKFWPNWHLEHIAGKLEACRQGMIKRLIINVPPRSLKSLAGSIALPAWWLGHNPSAQIIAVSYAQNLSDKLARDCRTLMMSTWYQSLFPTRLSSERKAVGEFVTTMGGSRLATSVSGVLTGRGADAIIIDDPLKPDEALSDARRATCNAWYDTVLLSRLNDKRNGCIILIMQRLHEDDLVDHVLEQEFWDVVSFPAIAEDDQTYVIESPFGSRTHRSRVGDVLHPEREPLATLESLRSSLGPYNFAGQYQQAPAPAGGGMVQEAWFARYNPEDRPQQFEQVVQSWDTANKPSELADYSVCTTWGVKNQHFFLLHVLRKKLGYPDLKRAVIEQSRLFAPSVILIEDKASGTQLIQELREAGISTVTCYKPEGDKIMRLNAQTGAMEGGFVHLPQQAHWLADYLHELVTFPKGRHDDQVDSTAQAFAWSKQRVPGWGIFEFTRMMVEQDKRLVQKMVKLRMPTGVTHACTITGQQVACRDGLFKLTEEDARPLMAAGFTLVRDQ